MIHMSVQRDGSHEARATAELRREHQLILKVVDALEHILTHGPVQEPDLESVEDAVRFFRLFVDACHHGQEEDLLFDELGAIGVPRATGPIAVMLAEHRQGRALVAAMTTALDRVRGGDPDALDDVVSAGLDYVALIRAHIAKEDGILFTTADNVLGPAACERLCAGYHRVCAGTFDGPEYLGPSFRVHGVCCSLRPAC